MQNYQNNMRYDNNMRYGRSGCMNGYQQSSRENSRPVPMPGRMDSRSAMPASCRLPKDQLEGMALAMAYVPWQQWRKVCDPHKGIQMGTIFEELNKPFLGRGGCNR